MSPLVRSRFRLLACALPALSFLCATQAHAAVGVSPVSEPSTAVAAESAAITTSAPAAHVLAAPAKAGEDLSSSSSSPAGSSEALPEAPQPVVTATPSSDAFLPATSTGGTAPKFADAIPSGWSAQPLSAGDKVILGFRNIASPYSVAGVIIGAGYAHITDGQPNYGVDGTAFAKRFGAGMARSASQSVFTTSVLSPILHQDTRYYVLGPQANFFHRVIYAATRPIIGRTDGGHTTINASLLIGYAGAAALTRTYYPEINRNFNDEAATYGSSLGGAAIGFAVDEFSDQLLKAIHLKRGN